MQDHRKLRAFTLADTLVLRVYAATREFPTEERFGLVSQLRRAAISVPTNIVEGCGRESQRELVRFLYIAFGSLREVGYLVDVSHRLGFLPPDEAGALLRAYDEAASTLRGLINKISL